MTSTAIKAMFDRARHEFCPLEETSNAVGYLCNSHATADQQATSNWFHSMQGPQLGKDFDTLGPALGYLAFARAVKASQKGGSF